jgi:hypothetical protein
VFAIDARQPAAPAPMSGETGALTDDRGEYRLFGLAPKTYLIVATTNSLVTGGVLQPSAREMDAALARLRERSVRSSNSAPAPLPPAASSRSAFAPMFYPGTTNMADAQRVTLRSGDVRDGLDFAMTLVPLTSIEGTVVSPGGTLPASLKLSISGASTLQFFALGSVSPQLVVPPDANGHFKYSTIAPGHYTVFVTGNSARPPATGGRNGGAPPGMSGREAAALERAAENQLDTLFGRADIDVNGAAVSDLAIRLQRGGRLAGRVVFDGGSPPSPADLAKMTVALLGPLSANCMSVGSTSVGCQFPTPVPVAVRGDGSFEIVGVPPASYRLDVGVPPELKSRWWFRRGVVADHDVFDSAFDVGAEEDISNVVLTMSDQHTELSGRLQSSSGVAAPEFFIVAMPANPALRAPESRRVQRTRPAIDGQFSFADLPPGDYLIVALTDIDADDFSRLDFLNEIAAGGVKVTVRTGERTQQDLRVGAP